MFPHGRLLDQSQQQARHDDTAAGHRQPHHKHAFDDVQLRGLQTSAVPVFKVDATRARRFESETTIPRHAAHIDSA